MRATASSLIVFLREGARSLMPWGLRHANLFKNRFGISVFLRILQNIKEHLFYRTPLGDCFCLTLCEIEHIFPLTLVDDIVLWLNFYVEWFSLFQWIFFKAALHKKWSFFINLFFSMRIWSSLLGKFLKAHSQVWDDFWWLKAL